jgi:hypothetical protein
LYKSVRSMYAAGGVLVSKKLPPAPTSFEEGLEMARDAFRYSGTVDNYIRTKVKPVINGTLMLASGNREFDSAAEEVLANNDDSDVQAMVEKAQFFADKIRSISLDAELAEAWESVDDPHDLVTEFNALAVDEALANALSAARLSAPGMRISPNDKVYIDTSVPWIIDMSAANVGIKVAKDGTVTGDLGTAVLSHTAGRYSTAFQMSDLDTDGYIEFPPKNTNYKWVLSATAHLVLFNDNGTGAQGDVSAAARDLASIRMWTAETLGGTAVRSNALVSTAGDALTNSGDEVYQVAHEISVEIEPSSASSVAAQWVHVDYSFGNVTTAGVAGLSVTSFSVSNVRLTGYLDGKEVDYSDITYRDASAIRAIGRSDSYFDYLGKLVMNPQDDPNLSVPALYAKRFSDHSTLIGGLVSAMKNYSATYHPVGSRIDDKYIRLGCVNGIEDMVGTVSLFSRTAAPYGETLSTSVTDRDEMSLLMATFVHDIRIFAENVHTDARIQKIVAKYLSYTTSANVHYD